ncbi:response regulator [Roseomonas aeriglobus]|nr:response regulator [Roseomonas aeriglobus]
MVDDDRDLGASVARLLRRQGFAAEPFLNSAVLIDVYKAGMVQCIVTDVMMGDIDAFVDRLGALGPAVAIIFITAWPTTRMRWIRCSATAGSTISKRRLTKPVCSPRLKAPPGAAPAAPSPPPCHPYPARR